MDGAHCCGNQREQGVPGGPATERLLNLGRTHYTLRSVSRIAEESGRPAKLRYISKLRYNAFKNIVQFRL